MTPRAAGRDCYAVVAPGLERLTADELRTLSIAPVEIGAGGVAFRATDAELFRANLELRTASRILVRIAEFRATAFHELERLARGVPWDAFVREGGAVALRVTCRKSRLYHSDGVAERVAGAIARRVSGALAAKAAHDPDDDAGRAAPAPSQLFAVRLDHDRCTISVDSSGERLHRRGYRLATAKAPIRETLAAAAVLAMAWRGDVPLIDPMCGAGTIAIEAALLARRIAPGLARTFSCESWPGADAAALAGIRAAARGRILPNAAAPILASDRDAGAVEAAIANAARAGVGTDVEIRRAALSAVAPPPGPGLLLTNPPYGERVGGKELRNLYAQLGKFMRTTFAGWTLAFISADRALDAELERPLTEVLRFRNGGIPVRLVRG